MAVIDIIDPVNRLIYLHADTVGVDLDPMEIYYEMRTLRRNGNEAMRGQDVFLTGEGNVPTVPGKGTERFVICVGGTRIVPFDVNQNLSVIGKIITDDGFEGRGCFDRSLLSVTTEVNIDYTPPQVETITIATGGSVIDLSAIADAVWDKDLADHTTSGTFGNFVQKKLLTLGKFLGLS
jgi:hypothetical protein|tara:strand:+ start:5469 stop:6005 length:537 start_codon:yes stop_codon:yes gene_type:complete